MKKYLFSNIILCLISFLTISASAGPIITIQFEIGRVSKGCHGLGICKITKARINWNENSTPNIVIPPDVVYGNASVEKGKLNLSLPKNGMTKETAADYFGGEFFIIEEDFELPKEICDALSIPSYTIIKGKYKISKAQLNYLLIL
jgi:hypothetical protein